MKYASAILWLHRDLRLGDNPALSCAVREAERVAVAYIHAPEEQAPFEPGAASRWWLHYSLEALADALAERDQRLVLRSGPSLDALRALIRETNAEAVYWNRRYEPALVARDRRIEQVLAQDGVTTQTSNGSLLNEPWEIRNRSGGPYRVFTAYHRAALERGVERPRPVPRKWSPPPAADSELLSHFGLLPRVDWAAGLRSSWTPGEEGARRRFSVRRRDLGEYAERRDRPDLEGTSRLSPHLAFGEVSARQLLAKLGRNAPQQWVRQLYWREFAYHLLHHFPHTTSEPLNEQFEHFPWRSSKESLRRWQRGRTGVPLVDAGMKQLWHTGWMHNRVRMVVGSFLVKHLLIPWQEGAAWFWDTLVDADLPNNTLGWQWVAGSGADAAPYFRVFNPELQAKRFDPDRAYVRRWAPEYLSGDAPAPIVGLAEGRKRALLAYERVRPGRRNNLAYKGSRDRPDRW